MMEKRCFCPLHCLEKAGIKNLSEGQKVSFDVAENKGKFLADNQKFQNNNSFQIF